MTAADEVSRRLQLEEPIPKLCVLVTASAFDAALHDAFGKVHGLSSYHTYGRDFMTHDLSHYLGPEFKSEYLDRYLLMEPSARLALYHSVGASDAIEDSDIRKPTDDGLPETLSGWIRYNGLTHIKIKLAGDDLEWDLDRVDRKSTRLNSSHVSISYAVFCLKKKSNNKLTFAAVVNHVVTNPEVTFSHDPPAGRLRWILRVVPTQRLLISATVNYLA